MSAPLGGPVGGSANDPGDTGFFPGAFASVGGGTSSSSAAAASAAATDGAADAAAAAGAAAGGGAIEADAKGTAAAAAADVDSDADAAAAGAPPPAAFSAALEAALLERDKAARWVRAATRWRLQRRLLELADMAAAGIALIEASARIDAPEPPAASYADAVEQGKARRAAAVATLSLANLLGRGWDNVAPASVAEAAPFYLPLAARGWPEALGAYGVVCETVNAAAVGAPAERAARKVAEALSARLVDADKSDARLAEDDDALAAACFLAAREGGCPAGAFDVARLKALVADASTV